MGWNNISIPNIETIEIGDWKNNFIPHLAGHVLIYAGFKVNPCQSKGSLAYLLYILTHRPSWIFCFFGNFIWDNNGIPYKTFKKDRNIYCYHIWIWSFCQRCGWNQYCYFNDILNAWVHFKLLFGWNITRSVYLKLLQMQPIFASWETILVAILSDQYLWMVF